MSRICFWKSGSYVAWRLHTVYGVPYDQGMIFAMRAVIKKQGLKQTLLDVWNLNRWLRSIHRTF